MPVPPPVAFRAVRGKCDITEAKLKLSAPLTSVGVRASPPEQRSSHRRGSIPRKAVQIRQLWSHGRVEKIGFLCTASVFGNSGCARAVLKSGLKMQRQLAVMQPGQGWWSFKRLIQPSLQFAVNKELLTQQGDQIR